MEQIKVSQVVKKLPTFYETQYPSPENGYSNSSEDVDCGLLGSEAM
jgi:hypothetical protein